jgi:ketosteroid isomerase-like protein
MSVFSIGGHRRTVSTPALLLLVFLAAAPAGAQTMTVTTSSDEARTLFEEGRAATGNVDMTLARARYDAALVADPGFVLAHVYRAAISPPAERATHLAALDGYAAHASEGERLFVEAFRANAAGDPDGELAILDDLSGRYPDDVNVHYLRGIRHMGAEHYDAATEALERAAALDPTFGGAYNILGYTALKQGDHARAEAAFRTYVRLVPDHANPYDSLGEFYLLTGRYDEAIPQFEAALARDPAFVASRNNLVWAHVAKTTAPYEAAFARGDAAAVAAFFTPGATLLPDAAEPVRGGEAVRAYWQAGFDRGLGGIDVETEEVIAMGDMAYETGRYTRTMASGQTAGSGKYSLLWRQLNGEWKQHRLMWNDDAPPATAAGN